MMRQLGIDMHVTCDKDQILEKLRENRELHSKLVAEARKGYIARAQEALAEKLSKLREGKVTELSFMLSVPRDFTGLYDTAIAMLEAHTEPTIELSAGEFRHFLQDEWDWTREFVAANAIYSGSTSEWAVSKGYIDEPIASPR